MLNNVYSSTLTPHNITTTDRQHCIETTALIEDALIHQNREIRLDALEFVCSSRRRTDPISSFELKCLLTFLVYNITDVYSPFRHKAFILVDKMLTRLRDSAKKLQQKFEGTSSNQLQSVLHFINWITIFLIHGMYPGASYSRLTASLELFHFLVNAFSPRADNDLTFVTTSGIDLEIFKPHTSEILFHCLRGRYDDDRRTAYEILKNFPAPIPGYETPQRLARLTKTALEWLTSPRMHECDTACLTLNVIVEKFIKTAHWSIRVQNNEVICLKENSESLNATVLRFLEDILVLVDEHIKEAKDNLAKAAMSRPMHGPLMTIRYILSDIEFTADEIKQNGTKWKELVAQVIERTYTVRDIAFTVGHPLRYRFDQDNDDVPPSANKIKSGIIITNNNEVQDDDYDKEEDNELYDEFDFVEFSHGEGQAIVVCAWLSIKEVSLLLATIVKKFTTLSTNEKIEISDESPPESFKLLTELQIEKIGNKLLDTLLQIRHKGAIEKAATGLQAVCEVLFACQDPKLHNLPVKWLNFLLEKVTKTANRLLSQRRSAGLPPAFLCILRAEAQTKRRGEAQGTIVSTNLLHQTFHRLLDIANNKLPHLQESIRKGECYHQVHALNIIRSILCDHLLFIDVSPLVEEALITVIELYTSSQWPVQNSATMTFSTIVGRFISSKQTRRDEQPSAYKTAVNGVTCSEFFFRFPRMRSFLLHKLSTIWSDQSKEIGTKAARQTALYAILILLSRLLPSRMENPKDEQVEKSLVPFVRKCSTSSDFMVRTMSARALVALIPSKSFCQFLSTELIDSLPTAPHLLYSHNQVHGLLLQIQILLRGHEPLLFKEARQELYYNVLPRLQNYLWLVTESHCPPLSSLFLEIVAEFIFAINHPNHTLSDVLSGLCGPSATLLRNFMESTLQVARNLLQKPNTLTSTTLSNEVMIYKLRKISAKICLHVCFVAPSEYKRILSDNATDLLVSLLTDGTYEVRLLTLKFLIRQLSRQTTPSKELLFDSQLIQLLLLSRLGLSFPRLMQLHEQRKIPFSLENNPKCVFYTLKIISLLPVLLPDEVFQNFFTSDAITDTPNAIQNDTNLWKKLSDWTHSKASKLIKEGILFMGTYIYQFCEYMKRVASNNRILDVTKVEEMFSEWLTLCTTYSIVNQPVELRHVVATSIASARLSHRTISSIPTPLKQCVTNATIQSWLIALHLLQDDDEELRLEMARHCSAYSLSVATENAADRKPLHTTYVVAKAIESTFAYLSSYFGFSQLYFDCLINIIKQPEPVRIAFESSKKDRDLLFEIEKDNIFVDSALAIQFASYHIKYLFSHSESNVKVQRERQLREWYSTLTMQLHDAVEWLQNTLGASKELVVDWLFYDEHKFGCLFRVLMGIATVLECCHFSHEELQPLISEVDKFQRLPNQHPTFRFLCTHIGQLVQQPEKLSDATTYYKYLSLYFLSGVHLNTVKDEMLSPLESLSPGK